MNPPFVFDCSSIRVLRNYYSAQFPTFWQLFDAAIANGVVTSVRDVFGELEDQLSGSWLWPWIKANKSMFKMPVAAETEFIGTIFAVPHFRALIGERQILTGKPVADPFVIASARISGSCVVTEESHKPHAAKIPNVCEHFGIECTNVEGFLKEMGWKF